MQRPPPRWPPPMPPAPWGRPAFVPPVPPPPRAFPFPPRFYPRSPCPATGYHPRFVPPRPVDPDQLWLDSFRRTHCSSQEKLKRAVNEANEPPLRLLRRRVAQAQKLAEQLKEEAMALAGVEERMASSENAATSVEGSRLRVQRERKTAMCEALKSQLEAMNVTSGLFPEQQLAGSCAFAARVDKKKAYRKRVKRRRCAEASLSRAANAKKVEKVGSTDDSTATKEDAEKPRDREEASRSDTVFPESRPSEQCLDPETLTLDSLIKVRRAWDLYIVFPQTRGASAIPPHFVSPPPTPSAPWAEYASLSS